MSKPDSNLLYLYDLPKQETTSVRISEKIKELAGYELNEIPQIRRMPERPFFSAIIKINDGEKFKDVSSKMKYFDIGGKECRALPFDKELLGANRERVNKERNIFIRKLNENMKASELEKILSDKVGVDLKSTKISINEDHTSRRYAFATFATQEGAKKAIEICEEFGFEVHQYNPKDKKDMQKIYNNIYVKNFPSSWDQSKLEEVFKKYGTISSIFIKTVKRDDQSESKFAFVCFTDKDDILAGPKQASLAVEQENGKIYDDQPIYVREALKKLQREQEKRKEQLRFKQSKKRCNLYVKNFPPNTTEPELRDYFSRYGEIESIKLFPKEGECLYAFVCFKSPDNAALARQQLNMQTFNGKQLYVNHYELKEVRKIQQEEARDKADFQNHKKMNPTSISPDVLNNPQVVQIIQMLIQQIGRNQFQQRAYNYQNRQGGGNPRGPPGQGQQRSYGQQQGRPQIMGQPGPMPGMMQQPAPAQRPPVSAMAMVNQPGMMAPQQNIPPHILEYLKTGSSLIHAVAPNNPNYKTQVGEFIYEYVEQSVGEEKAPKITGMLIDLHPDEIRGYLVDFGRFQFKIQEAMNLLNQTPQ